jgi:hypothetical protein
MPRGYTEISVSCALWRLAVESSFVPQSESQTETRQNLLVPHAKRWPVDETKPVIELIDVSITFGDNRVPAVKCRPWAVDRDASNVNRDGVMVTVTVTVGTGSSDEDVYAAVNRRPSMRRRGA